MGFAFNIILMLIVVDGLGIYLFQLQLLKINIRIIVT